MKIILATFLSIVFMLTINVRINACTNFLITKGASADGSTMISYSADSHVLYGELYFWAAADHAEGAMLDIYEWDTGKYLGKIKQVRHTFSVVGNMNEHQVTIGETTFGGREELADSTGIIDYGSLIYITLQRAKTAREAIKIMGELVAEYGYYSSGESFSIADPNEVWMLEMIGKGTEMVTTGKGKNAKTYNKNKGAVWVAVRIPDGYVAGHANQARIRQFPLNDPENCIYAPDIITFAREKGYFKGNDKDFSFVDAYAPLSFGGLRFCDARVWAGFLRLNASMSQFQDYAMGLNSENPFPLYIKPDKKVTVQDVMMLMRDHYEGTPMDMTKDPGAGPFGNPYRWRPLTWKVDGVTYLNERATATQQTGFVFVSQARSWLPDQIGGIHWFGVDDAASTVFTPMYCGITDVPHAFAVGNGSMMEFSDESAFWIFNQVSNFAYTGYNYIHPDVVKVQQELENKYVAYTKLVDATASDMYKKDPELARQFITDFSVNQGQNTFKRWKKLYAELFTRYMDGNVKTALPVPANHKYIPPKVKNPGYSEEWKRMVIEKTDDLLKEKPLKGEEGSH